jgi:SAM-dependent methyltransferase
MATAALTATGNDIWANRLIPELDALCQPLRALDHAAAHAGIGQFTTLLNSCRRTAGEGKWKDLIERVVRAHPSFALLQEDPFTRRSFVKPRGYAGDPALLDFIYEHPASFAEREAATAVGKFVSRFSTRGSAAEAVRERRGILARAIDDAAQRVKSPKILSMAYGYLREAEVSHAFLNDCLGRLVAVDHDGHTAEHLRSSYRQSALEARLGGPRDLLTRSYREQLGSDFDLVYAAGLFDYLSDRFAARLLSAMFDLLAPGGRVLVANFAPGLHDTGYMEACMDWWLIYRTPRQMAALSGAIDPHRIATSRIFRDSHQKIVYLEVTKG